MQSNMLDMAMAFGDTISLANLSELNLELGIDNTTNNSGTDNYSVDNLCQRFFLVKGAALIFFVC